MSEGWVLVGTERGTVSADHPMLAGHFPGHPIVPGAWLLAWIVATAARQLTVNGDARTIAGVKRVKFRRPLAPDQPFECMLKIGAETTGAATRSNDTVRFAITGDGAVIAEGSLQLQPLRLD